MGTKDRPRRLGRGLSSLVSEPVSVGVPEALSDPSPMEAPDTPASPDRHSTMVPIENVVPSPFQARESFDDAALEGLAASIRRSGIMQPIVLRRTDEGLELVAGERRWRAAKLAELTHVPAVIRTISDEESAELGLVENVQREDLNPIERARAFSMLATTFDLTHAEIAERVGVSRPSVSNFVRLLELEEPLQDRIIDGSLSAGHAKVLLSLTPGGDRVTIGERSASSGWSVRRLEHEVGRLLQVKAPPSSGRTVTTHLAELERQLSDHLGSQVRIRADSSGQKGRIEIAFYDLDHFDGLMSRFGFKMS